MGIPRGFEEIDASLVVAGNPFTDCTIVNKSRTLVQLDIPRAGCRHCGLTTGGHNCQRPTDVIPDQYYFEGPGDRGCRMYDSSAMRVDQHL